MFIRLRDEEGGEDVASDFINSKATDMSNGLVELVICSLVLSVEIFELGISFQLVELSKGWDIAFYVGCDGVV